MAKEWETYAQLAGSMKIADEVEEEPHGMSDVEELRRIGAMQQANGADQYDPQEFAQELGL